MNNAKKIILDLCGGTGAWSAYYRKAGYDVRVLTLPEWDITQANFDKGFIFFKSPVTGNGQLIHAENVYGILAAPPCTMFSRARQRAKTPRDFVGGMAIVEACLRIIWHCRAYGNLQFWALENPVGYLRQFLGAPAFTFEPWHFGDRRTKRTDIWGYFNRPATKRSARKPSGRTGHKSVAEMPVHLLPELPAGYFEKMSWQERRAARRAVTPPGFARAFYRANK